MDSTTLLSIIGLVFAATPSVVLVRNRSKLNKLRTQKYEQQLSAEKALENLSKVENRLNTYDTVHQRLNDFKNEVSSLENTIQAQTKKLSLVIEPVKFEVVNQEIIDLSRELQESLKEESLLIKKTQPILERLEREKIEKAEAERKARKKREEEEEEERRRRRRNDSYNSSSSSSFSSSSSSSWSGGGGFSSGGGASGSW